MNHAFVVFFYGVFPGAFQTLANMDITLHSLCTSWDVLDACKDRPYFSEAALSEGRRSWRIRLLVGCAWRHCFSRGRMARKAAAEG